MSTERWTIAGPSGRSEKVCVLGGGGKNKGAITPTRTLVHQSTLSLSGRGADYAHLITLGPPNFLDLPITLIVILTEHAGGLNVGGLCLGKKCAFLKEG